jgi:hypothetical protein
MIAFLIGNGRRFHDPIVVAIGGSEKRRRLRLSQPQIARRLSDTGAP